jgi:hypothetical protein
MNDREEVHSIQLWGSYCGTYLGLIYGHEEDSIKRVIRTIQETDTWSVCYECQKVKQFKVVDYQPK